MKKLADILAIAPVLKECNIVSQSGNREVYVEVDYATEGNKGAIVINVRSTREEIYQRETDKREA